MRLFLYEGWTKKKTDQASLTGFPHLALFTKNKVPSNIFYCSYYVVVYEIKSVLFAEGLVVFAFLVHFFQVGFSIFRSEFLCLLEASFCLIQFTLQ